MPVQITDPAALVTAAACYKCIPAGMQPEVQIYLLNVISGLNLSPAELMERSACYKCIPQGQLLEVQVMLMNEIANQ